MARTRKHRNGNGKKSIKIPVAIVAGFVPGIASIYGHRGSGFEGMAAEASRIYLGYASTNKFGYNDTIGFHPYLLKYGTLPILAGFGIHWLANKIGVNRAIANAGIPFIRV